MRGWANPALKDGACAQELGHRGKDWWPDVARHNIKWHETRDEALAEESRAINQEHPIYNGGGTARRGRIELSRRAKKYTPPAILSERLAAWEEAGAAFESAYADLIASVVDELRAGAVSSVLAEHLPWSGETVRTIAREYNIPRKRKPTVRSIKTRRRTAGGKSSG